MARLLNCGIRTQRSSRRRSLADIVMWMMSKGSIDWKDEGAKGVTGHGECA